MDCPSADEGRKDDIGTLVRPSHIGIDVALLSTHSSSRNSIRQTTVGLHDVYLRFLTQVMGIL